MMLLKYIYCINSKAISKIKAIRIRRRINKTSNKKYCPSLNILSSLTDLTAQNIWNENVPQNLRNMIG